MTSLRVEIDTDSDKVFNEDLIEIAKKLRSNQILQIFSAGSKIVLNVRIDLTLELIDSLEGLTLFSRNIRIKTVSYAGKKTNSSDCCWTRL